MNPQLEVPALEEKETVETTMNTISFFMISTVSH